MTEPRQIRTHTHEHGRVYAQVEQFDGRPHLALQPVTGGAAHRFELDRDNAELEQLLEDYPELQHLVDEHEAAPAEAAAPAGGRRRRPEAAQPQE